METTFVRPELPEMTTRIAALPVFRGYPVPWFVAWFAGETETLRGEGVPDFRVLASGSRSDAHNRRRCWICGEYPLGVHQAFVVGPMCAVNRTSAEPPSHFDCAAWAVKACPFMVRPHMVRREAGLPGETEEAPGLMLKRNPGVTLIWVTRKYGLRRLPDDEVLFDIGQPEWVAFYREGREASRDEVLDSINSGLPSLREIAALQGDHALAALDRAVDEALLLLPAT